MGLRGAGGISPGAAGLRFRNKAAYKDQLFTAKSFKYHTAAVSSLHCQGPLVRIVHKIAFFFNSVGTAEGHMSVLLVGASLT